MRGVDGGQHGRVGHRAAREQLDGVAGHERPAHHRVGEPHQRAEVLGGRRQRRRGRPLLGRGGRLVGPPQGPGPPPDPVHAEHRVGERAGDRREPDEPDPAERRADVALVQHDVPRGDQGYDQGRQAERGPQVVEHRASSNHPRSRASSLRVVAWRRSRLRGRGPSTAGRRPPPRSGASGAPAPSARGRGGHLRLRPAAPRAPAPRPGRPRPASRARAAPARSRRGARGSGPGSRAPAGRPPPPSRAPPRRSPGRSPRSRAAARRAPPRKPFGSDS